MITTDEYLAFAGRALDGMRQIVIELGDDLANTSPPLAGANSPYAILHHCLGVMEYWVGHLVMGRPSDRDRAAEFTASGPIDELVRRVTVAQSTMIDDLPLVDMRAPLQGVAPAAFLGPEFELTRGAALLHVYEELAQHHGQMELVRDILLAR